MNQEMLTLAYAEKIEINSFYDSLPKSTKLHCRCVAKMAGPLFEQGYAAGLGGGEMESFSREQIEAAILYHDLGITMIPERILNKPEELTGAEWRVIYKHTHYGGRILEEFRKQRNLPPIEDQFWQLAAEVALSHHERWDGSGYPYGQVANAIPFAARVTAIVDSYDAIVRGAPYRMALPHEYAILEIMDNAGKQFDPELVCLFKNLSEELCMIRAREIGKMNVE